MLLRKMVSKTQYLNQKLQSGRLNEQTIFQTVSGTGEGIKLQSVTKIVRFAPPASLSNVCCKFACSFFIVIGVRHCGWGISTTCNKVRWMTHFSILLVVF